MNHPHEFNENHKPKRIEISSALLLRNQNNPFLDIIVTCEEKYVLYGNRKCSAQWIDVDKALQHLPKPKLHQKKIMGTVWWSLADLIHHCFIKPGETITVEKYCREI